MILPCWTDTSHCLALANNKHPDSSLWSNQPWHSRPQRSAAALGLWSAAAALEDDLNSPHHRRTHPIDAFDRLSGKPIRTQQAASLCEQALTVRVCIWVFECVCGCRRCDEISCKTMDTARGHAGIQKETYKNTQTHSAASEREMLVHSKQEEDKKGKAKSSSSVLSDQAAAALINNFNLSICWRLASPLY